MRWLAGPTRVESMLKLSAEHQRLILILAVLLALARLALDFLAELRGAPPVPPYTTDIVLLIVLILALASREQTMPAGGPRANTPAIWMILLAGFVLGLSLPAFAMFLTHPD
jgi:drug/metabolite transporter (DMT)-like permease